MKKNKTVERSINRRDFLKLLGITGVAALGVVYVDMDQSWVDYDTVVDKNKNTQIKESNMNTEYKNLIRIATLAASGHNTQPWRFTLDGSHIQIHPDMTRHLSVVDPDDREMWISLGCALENLVIAAGEAGFAAHITYPDSHDFIDINLNKVEPAHNELLNAITSRQNTRSLYDGKALPGVDLDRLKSLTLEPGINLKFLAGTSEMDTLSEFIRQGTLAQYENSAFIDELIHWIRFNKKEALTSMDGLYSRCSGNPDIPRFIGSLFVRGTSPQQQADADIKKLLSSSGAVVISSGADTRADWVRTGQIYERLALTMTTMNVKSSFLNQPVEVGQVRSKLGEALGLGNNRPQLLVRFGYADGMAGSMRRPIDQVI